MYLLGQEGSSFIKLSVYLYILDPFIFSQFPLKSMFTAFIRFLKKDAFRGNLSYRTNKTAFFISFLVVFILFFFKPFGIEQLNNLAEQSFLIIGYAICSIIGYSVAITLFSPYNKSKWTRLHEIGTYFTCVLIIWLLVYVYSIFCFKILFYEILDKPSGNYEIEGFFIKSFYYTFGIAILVFPIIYMYDLSTSPKDLDIKTVDLSLNHGTRSSRVNHKTLVFNGKNKNEQLTIEEGSFVCIKSEGHYIRIYYLCPRTNELKYMFLRSTMKEIENQTINSSFVFRCHNSFFINLNYLKSTIGNSNKSHLYLTYFSDPIPISKSKISFIKEYNMLYKKGIII